MNNSNREFQQISNNTDNNINLTVDPETQLVTVEDVSPSISVLWDRAVQQAVINTAPGPTVASRAYGILHTATYDAWSAYDPLATSTQLGDNLQRPQSENTDANKTEAMSFAAYRVLSELFPSEVKIFNDVMAELGFYPDNTTTDTTTPAGIGNVSAEALLTFRRNDGSNQLGNDPNGDGTPYSDISGYQPINSPGETTNIEFWTPERVPIDALPGEEQRIQTFLTPQWGKVTPFSPTSLEEIRPEAPEPFLLVPGEVDKQARTITLADGSVVDITPDIVGTIINPGFIEQTQRIVDISANLTDEQKLIAEFWEDGGSTSFPPGTWMTFGQFVSARDNHTLDLDVKLFFNLGNAVFDAGIVAWDAKTFYDYARPVRTVRELGELSLIGEFNPELGGFAIDAWAGPGEGTQTILATDFLTYQTPGSDPSPPFAEYVSGHSTFSAAGAEILQRFTGSDDFGASVSFGAGESRFEPGVTPESPLVLEWETFSEAADEAGISRLYGGIHFDDGDINGRQLGREVGESVWSATESLISPNITLGRDESDELIGTAENNFISGHRQNDLIPGGDGNDLLYGGKGNDTVDGGAGIDIIGGHRGDDILIGGPGGDRFDFALGHGNDIIVDFEDGIDAIGLLGGLSFEQLTISQVGNDTRISVDQLSITLQGVSESVIGADDFIELG
ncbi:MAG: calcium-binding protein [Trichodesmium sp. MO_231.B1]|nr:calcium-binding protein [Trichodesmium sp. MO_231.B1]